MLQGVLKLPLGKNSELLFLTKKALISVNTWLRDRSQTHLETSHFEVQWKSIESFLYECKIRLIWIEKKKKKQNKRKQQQQQHIEINSSNIKWLKEIFSVPQGFNCKALTQHLIWDISQLYHILLCSVCRQQRKKF